MASLGANIPEAKPSTDAPPPPPPPKDEPMREQTPEPEMVESDVELDNEGVIGECNIQLLGGLAAGASHHLISITKRSNYLEPICQTCK